ncbi:MAG: SxtJ family membrane protein [Desulfuromonadales bacterium]
MSTTDKWRVKVLETHNVLALAALSVGLLAGTRWLLWSGIFLLVLATFVKPVASLLARGWLKLSEKIANVNNMIILTILYYLILTPIALVFRQFNKDPLQLDLDGTDSFYSERNHLYSKADLEKMW